MGVVNGVELGTLGSGLSAHGRGSPAFLYPLFADEPGLAPRDYGAVKHIYRMDT